MRFGLSETVINRICMVFAHYPEIALVVLYGSRAKGNFREGSDIDLTFYVEEGYKNLLQRLASEIDALNLPWMFDLSIYQEISSDDLRAHIARVGKVFCRKETAKKIVSEDC